MALIEVRLRPAGPWRVGHHAGDRERVDAIYHSDALFSAITHAMRVFGWLDEWLDATVRADSPAVRFSSLFPFIGKTRLITPPKSAWPPANPGKLYLQGMKLVPLEIARGGVVDEARWTPDGASECLIPQGSASPFHVSLRSAAAVDRLTGAVEPHRTACLEFASNAGFWGLFDAANGLWEGRVKSAFRLLADSGFGGERSRGWGRAGEPSFSTASALFPDRTANGAWWLLSLYSPHENDAVDWSKGDYSAVVRGGWTDSPSGAGQKKSVRMIEEGSVLSAEAVRGQAVDVAPDGFAHPVYRNGFALAVPLPDKRIVPETPVVAASGEVEAGRTGGSACPAEEAVPPVEEVVIEPASEPIPHDSEVEEGRTGASACPPEEVSAPVEELAIEASPDETGQAEPIPHDSEVEEGRTGASACPPDEVLAPVEEVVIEAPSDETGQAEPPALPETSAEPQAEPPVLPEESEDGQAQAPTPHEEVKDEL